MKAITIKQPWVYAILNEGKDIENRSWNTKFRGWLAIHAAAHPARGVLLPPGCHDPLLDTLDYSAICRVTRLVDVVRKSRSKWFWRPDDGTTNYGWVLANVTALPKPVPCKGKLSLWNLPPDVFRNVQKQLSHLNLGG